MLWTNEKLPALIRRATGRERGERSPTRIEHTPAPTVTPNSDLSVTQPSRDRRKRALQVTTGPVQLRSVISQPPRRAAASPDGLPTEERHMSALFDIVNESDGSNAEPTPSSSNLTTPRLTSTATTLGLFPEAPMLESTPTLLSPPAIPGIDMDDYWPDEAESSDWATRRPFTDDSRPSLEVLLGSNSNYSPTEPPGHRPSITSLFSGQSQGSAFDGSEESPTDLPLSWSDSSRPFAAFTPDMSKTLSQSPASRKAYAGPARGSWPPGSYSTETMFPIYTAWTEESRYTANSCALVGVSPGTMTCTDHIAPRFGIPVRGASIPSGNGSRDGTQTIRKVRFTP